MSESIKCSICDREIKEIARSNFTIKNGDCIISRFELDPEIGKQYLTGIQCIRHKGDGDE